MYARPVLTDVRVNNGLLVFRLCEYFAPVLSSVHDAWVVLLHCLHRIDDHRMTPL